MFNLHQFFPLLEPAWQADPNKTAATLGELIAHAKGKKMDATACTLEHCLLQLAEGRSLAVVGAPAPAEPVHPAPPPPPPKAPSTRGKRGHQRKG